MGAPAPAAEAAQIRAEQCDTPLGWGIFSIARGRSLSRLIMEIFEILCRRAPALREAEQGLSKIQNRRKEEAPHS